MELVFDGPAQPYGLTPASVLTLIPLAWWAYEKFVRHKRSTLLLPVVSLALFSLINGIRLWDQWRIAHLPPDAVKVTRGVIEDSWHIVSRTRDWNQKSLSYRTTVSEGFDVAGLRFKWNVADSYSPATFSNAQDPPLTFPKGTPIEVTWFIDGATNDERRILRLRIGGTSPDRAVVTDGLEAFLMRFSVSFAAGDTAALDAMTRFPFAFGPHTMERAESATLWMGLLMPGLQSCVANAVPVPEGDDKARIECSGTVFAFERRGAEGWRFVGIPQAR